MSDQREPASVADLGWRALEKALVGVLAAMAIMVFGNVVLRYGFASGITVSEELSCLLFVWLTFSVRYPSCVTVGTWRLGGVGTDTAQLEQLRAGFRIADGFGLRCSRDLSHWPRIADRGRLG